MAEENIQEQDASISSEIVSTKDSNSRIVVLVVVLSIIVLLTFGFFVLNNNDLRTIGLSENVDGVVDDESRFKNILGGKNSGSGQEDGDGNVGVESGTTNSNDGTGVAVAPKDVSKVSTEVESLSQGNLYPYEIKGGKVYHLGIEIPGADPATFVHMIGNYSKDKDNVFYVSSVNRDFQIKVLSNADPATFATVGVNNAKDDNGVYYRSEEIIDADPDTFVVMWDDVTGNYSKDKFSVYYFTSRLNADPNTFEIIMSGVPGSYAKDAEGVYYFGREIAGADPATFKIIDEIYAEDINRQYRYGRVVK